MDGLCYSITVLVYAKSGKSPLFRIMFRKSWNVLEDRMQKSEIERKVSHLLEAILKELQLELYDVEYVREGKNNFLRIYIERDTGGICIDDCEHVSRRISDRLDAEDFIPDAYFLEVSSPGLDRQLKKPKDFIRYIGSKVDVKLYKPFNGEKMLCGTLTAFEDNTITIQREDAVHSFKLKDTASVKLTVEF